MDEVILFILGFIFIFLVYEFVIVLPAKKNREGKMLGKKKNRDPVEVNYLVTRYKLDMEKTDYNQLLQLVALTSSLDISIVVSLILAVEDFFLAVVVGIVAIVVLIIGSYHLVYLFYKRKGMIKND